MDSGRLHLNVKLRPGVVGEIDDNKNVFIAAMNDSCFAPTIIHEFWHYIHDSVLRKNDNDMYSIFETHSMGGLFLLLDELQAEYTKLTDESFASFLTLSAIWSELGQMVQGVIEYKLMPDIYAHPENYTGIGIAERFMEIIDELGVDFGYSEEYKILAAGNPFISHLARDNKEKTAL